jgi:hypothetical protein
VKEKGVNATVQKQKVDDIQRIYRSEEQSTYSSIQHKLDSYLK